MCACKNAGSGPLRLSHYNEGLSQYAYLLIEAGDGLQVSGNVRTVFFRLAKILEIGSPSNLFSVNASMNLVLGDLGFLCLGFLDFVTL